MPFGYATPARQTRKKGVKAHKDPDSDRMYRAAANNKARRRDPSFFW